MFGFEIQNLSYAAMLGLVWLVYAGLRAGRQRRSLAARHASHEAGLTEPASLHPRIDPSRCLGCGACVTACPERDVLGLIAGKAELVSPADCIGHGACLEECPFDAITLVLGTEKRGVDIPIVDRGFQTNVPGIFVAGELGGMGLIRNAVEQGRQCIESVRCLDGVGRGELLDVVIVGAGPAGFSASLAAKQHGLRAVTLEQDTLGGTVAHYPRGKIVMTAPVELPLFGKVRMKETSKEALLAFWERVECETQVRIRYGERVEGVERLEGGFAVRSARGTYRTRSVLLAIGRRGTPRKLGAEGEQSSKVVYRLIEPEQYRGQRVLVVGGGDSALEAATSLAETADTRVALAYRGAAFSRAKAKNRARVEEAERAGRLRVLLDSEVGQIRDTHVELELAGRREVLGNDAVIVCVGGILPTGFLESIGVAVETVHGDPVGVRRG